MLVDPKELSKNKEFWKEEENISNAATTYIKKLREHTVYDFHEIQPAQYNMRPDKEIKDKETGKKKGKKGGKVQGGDDGGGGGEKKKKEEGKEGGEKSKDAKEKAAEDANEIIKNKKKGLETAKQSALATTLENIQTTMGKTMPKFARGPDAETAWFKEVEVLKHRLSQQNCHVDLDVLMRAIIMPKDLDVSQATYPAISAMLQTNPNSTSKVNKMAKTKKKKKK